MGRVKTPLVILGIVALSLLAFAWLAPGPRPGPPAPRTDLPWQVTVDADGSSRVFDLDLGRATLEDAMLKFGNVEAVALFETPGGRLSLEAYFGTVRLGPLTAKIVARLAGSPDELAAMRDSAAAREGTPGGDWRYRLAIRPAEHAKRRLAGISYVPGTRSLDAGFFRRRFGEPAAWLRENARAVRWFYPELGLSILIDDAAREVLEYQPPRAFVMPPGVTPNPARG